MSVRGSSISDVVMGEPKAVGYASGPLLPKPPRRHLHSQRRVLLAFLAIGVPATLIAAFRGDTRDTSTYIDIFDATRSFPINPFEYYSAQGVEWGYGILNWAVNAAGLGWRTLFLLISLSTWVFLAFAGRELKLSLVAIAPFYLGTFYLTQQLMQIRQGLASALAFYVVLDACKRSIKIRHVLLGTAAVMFHSVALLPLAMAALWSVLRPRAKAPSNRAWVVAGIVAATILCARVASRLELLEATERLANYASDQRYNGARELWDPANVRALILLSVFTAAKVVGDNKKSYELLLVLFAVHVGIRLGFFDFEILSGRLAAALGFSEVFLAPMALASVVKSVQWRVAIAVTYFALHAAATVGIQTPYLMDDYATPIYGYSSTS